MKCEKIIHGFVLIIEIDLVSTKIDASLYNVQCMCAVDRKSERTLKFSMINYFHTKNFGLFTNTNEFMYYGFCDKHTRPLFIWWLEKLQNTIQFLEGKFMVDSL